MSNAAEIRGKLVLDARPMGSPIEEAARKLDSLVARTKDVGKKMAAAIGGYGKDLGSKLISAVGLGGGLSGIGDQIGAQITKGGEMHELSLQTGEGVGRLMQLQKAFKESGIASDSLAPQLARMQKALGGINEDGQDTTSTFAKLGLNAGRLKNMSPGEAFATVGNAIGQIPNASARASAAMQIFGKSGAEMLKLFRDKEALQGLRAPLTTSQRLMQANAALFDEIGDRWEGFKGKAKGGFGLFTGLAAGMAPGLLALLKQLPKIDLAGIGARIGKIGGLLMTGLASGDIGTVLIIAAKQFTNYLARNGLAAITGLGAVLAKILLSGDLYLGLAEGLLGAAVLFGGKLASVGMQLGAFILDGLGTVIAYLQAGFEWAFTKAFNAIARIPGAERLGIKAVNTSFEEMLRAAQKDNFMGQGAQFLRDNAESVAKSGDDKGFALISSAGSRLGNVMTGLTDEFKRSFSEVVKLIGDIVPLTADQKKKLAEMEAKYAATRGAANGKDSVGGLPGGEQKATVPKVEASALQRIGGGGGASSGSDPLLRMNERIAKAAEQTAANTKDRKIEITATPRFA